MNRKKGRHLRKSSNGFRLEESGKAVKGFLQRTYYKLIAAFVIAAGTTILFPSDSLYVRLEAPKLGEIATEDIIAPIDFYILKTDEEMERERQDELNRLSPFLVYDSGITDEVIESFDKFFEDLEELSSGRRTPRSMETFVSIYSGLTPDQARLLANKGIVKQQKPVVKELVSNLMETGVVDNLRNVPLAGNRLVTIVKDGSNITVPRTQVNDIPSIINLAETKFTESTDKENVAEALTSVFEFLIRPNLKFNLDLTEQAKEAALADISPYKGIVLKDERIIKKHERVNQAHVEKLRSLASIQGSEEGSERATARWLPIIARFVFISFLIGFIAAFMRYFRKDIYYSDLKMLLVGVIFVFMVLITYLIDVQWNLPPYLIPVALSAMILTILFDVEVGLLITFVVSILVGILRNFDFSIMFISIIAGTVGSYSVRKVRHRTDFYRPIIYTVGAYLISVYLVESLKLQPAEKILEMVGYAGFNGFISPLLAIALLPLFETVFRITTDITLLELSDLNRPLLKRLSLEAPGTYHHSVIMGTLAEEAAKSIGANSLLARVGAYYHDIGKALKAEYFVENQMGAKNKHEKLTPSMSALILESHVKEGREMARAAGLPQVIIDFIEQHHGDSVMSFFYQKALDMGAREEEASSFRYPGPKPNFRESAIVMLADSVEAASRTLEDPKPARIRSLVKKIIHEKIETSQLDDSNLTLRDISKIEDSFVYILSAIFHRRIEYPEKEEIAI
ncbi:MAG: HDIG domain-containing protein [candidate division Zixibacteria bacterium]|nr:HDIG domain-containing protein [candidate division Zixibacteria bacterium]